MVNLSLELRKFSELTINFDKERIPLSSSERESKKGKYPYYGAQGIIDHVDEYIFDGEYLLIAEDGENLNSRSQPIANVVLGKFWVNNHAHIVKTNSKCEIHYLCYLLNNINISGYITGSAQPKLNQYNLNNMVLEIQDYETQYKISIILKRINDKIKLNEKINKNLEELMHVLFKKYFIDNNPFYVENDEKWNIIKLKDLIIRNRDKINDFDNWKDELLIDLSNMPRFSIAISNFDKGKKFTSNIYKLNKYDLLFGSIRPYFGKVGFSPINGVVTGTVHSFKPIDDIYYSLVLSLISSKTFINYTVSVSKGTKMPSVKWDDFINYEFAIPDDLSKIGEYNKILLPLIHKIEKNILEIQRLTKLRDTLLPKLMSGEIDVSKINCDLELKYNYMKYLFNQIHTPMSKSVV